MSAKTYHITLNGKVYEVEIEEVQPGQVTKSTDQPVKEKTMQVRGNGEQISAPMPGSIFNILVKEGQTVKKGDVVAILEAMKMENEIISPIDGTITSINVEKGQNVNLGDVILVIG
ncbi:MAG: biotin/lipoyl-binding protein [Romboutsia sp.]|nr:biotin/lipoyl-binding protein [Romboutsia sp.]